MDAVAGREENQGQPISRALKVRWHFGSMEDKGPLGLHFVHTKRGVRTPIRNHLRPKTELRNGPGCDVMLTQVSHHPMTHLPEPPLFSPFTVFCPPTHQAAIHHNSRAEVDR
ncbi:hypothetical protein NPIL_450441 [Nephila pilipes]|uniref:Uncharacterized protein n=1 Tax=Nephila pilipes TaxID=299642 RepID=A0A8X6NFP9_NEPPI|nr:hypothetical protein NPIL_450441 [Nephila pilipes]